MAVAFDALRPEAIASQVVEVEYKNPAGSVEAHEICIRFTAKGLPVLIAMQQCYFIARSGNLPAPDESYDCTRIIKVLI